MCTSQQGSIKSARGRLPEAHIEEQRTSNWNHVDNIDRCLRSNAAYHASMVMEKTVDMVSHTQITK